MSRIGKIPITIEDGVKVTQKGNNIVVEGPKGKLDLVIDPTIKMKVDNNKIVVTRSDDTQRSKSLHGLYRNLLNNMVIGVTKGFSRVLQLNGVGYRAENKGKILVLNLGFSNPIEYPIPEGVNLEVEANTKITVSCINKQILGQTCAEIRSFRPPEPYKGKGIKYQEEYIRKKVGKAGIK